MIDHLKLPFPLYTPIHVYVKHTAIAVQQRVGFYIGHSQTGRCYFKRNAHDGIL